MILFLIGLVAGFVLLVKGADFFVDGAAGIATRFGIPHIIVGLTIVALGTSAPEAAVSITAAINGSAGITIGNVVGSNIMNILIILGLTSVIVPVAVKKSTIKVDMPFMILASILLLVLGIDGMITFIDGLILCIVFVGYMVYLFISAGKMDDDLDDEEGEPKSVPVYIAFAVGGMAAIIIGSKLAVYGASGIAHAIGVSDRIIGLTVVALGTSLPELFTSVTAARKGNADLAIGNIVGSNIFNALFVVGLTGIIIPVPYISKFMIDSVVMVLSAALLLAFSVKSKKLGRGAGIFMLAGYAAYFVYLLLN